MPKYIQIISTMSVLFRFLLFLDSCGVPVQVKLATPYVNLVFQGNPIKVGHQPGLASFCQNGKNQWQKPVITGMAKTLWQKWQKLAKTTRAKNICMGPSIKYVTLFLMIFDPPPPCHKLSQILDPPKSMSHF